MKLRLQMIFLLFFSVVLFSQQKRPKLVVGVVIDQMRDEYIDRFYEDFGNGGFKRLIKEGYRFKNMHFNYYPTFTAPGHSSIFTGATPAYHGIVGNYWYHRQEHKGVYCTADSRYQTIGESKEKREGEMSPYRMIATTVTDELRLFSNFRSKVIGISLKDRGAILPAGHFANAAYWMAGNGNFISSSFYADELPKWVTQFNNKKYYEKYLSKDWNLLRNESTYDESSPDNALFEGKLAEILEAKFPYDLKSAYEKSGGGIIKTTPFGNSILADFAKEALLEEQLGKDEFTDFLTLSFSSTDYIGHLLGPRSRELQDTYLRLDETLADLLNYLDKKIGKGQYLLFLTADHACAENPNFMNAHKMQVRNLDRGEIKEGLEHFTQETFGKNCIEDYMNQNVFLNLAKIEEANLNEKEVIEAIQYYLEEKDFVQLALSEEQLSSTSSNVMVQKIQNGYDPVQNGQIVVLFKPGFYEYVDFGTTHGSTYTYDTHVPMLWFGHGVQHGISYQKHEITEIAPTLSQLLHISLPNSSDNIVIEELLSQ